MAYITGSRILWSSCGHNLSKHTLACPLCLQRQLQQAQEEHRSWCVVAAEILRKHRERRGAAIERAEAAEARAERAEAFYPAWLPLTPAKAQEALDD